MSGIMCTDECTLLYDKLRLRQYCRYIIFNIEKVDGVEMIVKEREGPREETWEQMVDSLPAYEPRFIVYDFEYTDKERRKHADLLLITWTPDNCSVKQKVMFSSSKKAFHSKLVGSKIIDAFDADDLREDRVLEKIM
ncbi:hypothetical protein WA538_002486 [Blastocystis sp. DL]